MNSNKTQKKNRRPLNYKKSKVKTIYSNPNKESSAEEQLLVAFNKIK